MFKIILVTMVWVLAGVTAGWVVWGTKIGPTFFTISAEYGWGVHTGDFLAFIPLGLSALVTWLVLHKNK